MTTMTNAERDKRAEQMIETFLAARARLILPALSRALPQGSLWMLWLSDAGHSVFLQTAWADLPPELQLQMRSLKLEDDLAEASARGHIALVSVVEVGGRKGVIVTELAIDRQECASLRDRPIEFRTFGQGGQPS